MPTFCPSISTTIVLLPELQDRDSVIIMEGEFGKEKEEEAAWVIAVARNAVFLFPGGDPHLSLSLSFFGGQTETELQGWAMPGSLAASGEKVKKKSPETMTNLREVFMSLILCVYVENGNDQGLALYYVGMY